MKIKPCFKNLQSKFALLGIAIYFIVLPEVSGISLPTGFIPFIDISGDIGKSYKFLPRPVGVGSKWSYEGMTILPGFKYYLTKFPLTFQIVLIKGIPEIEDLKSPIYGCGSFGIIPYKKFQWRLEIVANYLRNFEIDQSHSALSGYFNVIRKGDGIDLGVLIGVYWENFIIPRKEAEFFLAGEITLLKWFICPYLNLALINRLSRDSEWLIREPKKNTSFISLGIRIQPSGKGYISNLINKILAPKRWGG